MSKETVYFDSLKESGNVFFILGKVIKVLKLQGKETESEEMKTAVMRSGSYEAALSIMREYVNLVDMSGRV